MSTESRSAARPDWQETKFRRRGGRLRGGGRAHVGAGSVLVTELLAGALDGVVTAHARGALVDVGCGRAPLLGTYGAQVDRAVLVDWPQSFHGAGAIDVFADVTRGLPFRDGVFDTALLSDVLEHAPDGERLVRELHRILGSGATLVGSVPFLYGLHEEPHDHCRYTRFGLEHLLVRCGFTVELIEPYGGSVDVIVDLVAKHLAGLGPVGRPVAVGLQRAWLGLRRAPVARGLRARLHEKFPLGYVFVARAAAPDRRGTT